MEPTFPAVRFSAYFHLQELQYKNNSLFFIWTLRLQHMLSSPNVLFHLSWFKIFCNVLKFFVIKTKIRESTHKSKLWARAAEMHIFIWLSKAVTRQKTHACTGVAQAGCAQLYCEGRQKHPEQWELAAVRTDFCAAPTASALIITTHHFQKCPLPSVPHTRGLFTSFHASTPCAGIRAKCIFTRRHFTSGMHLDEVHTSMPSTVFLTSYFNGINCLIW